MYILQCADGSYYTGSTKDLEKRLAEHQNGEGANHTKKRLPVELLYYEKYDRIDTAFYREKQVQGWSRAKKKALMRGDVEALPGLSIAYRDKVTEALEVTGFRDCILSDVEVQPSDKASENKIYDNQAVTGTRPTKVTEVLEVTGFQDCKLSRRVDNDNENKTLPETLEGSSKNETNQPPQAP